MKLSKFFKSKNLVKTISSPVVNSQATVANIILPCFLSPARLMESVDGGPIKQW